jgi:peptide/nickel transport system permease protein
MLNLVFFLPRFLPGSAASVLAAGYGGVPQQVVQSLNLRLGLGAPWYVQYEIYLKGIFLNFPPDFGVSYAFYPTSVSYLVGIRFPFTLLLIASSFVLASLLSFVMAVFSSRRRGSKFEFGSMYSSIIFWATPPFWLGLVLAWIFGVYLGWLPVAGTSAFTSANQFDYWGSVIQHLILPVVTLTAATFGFQFLILRGAAQQVLESDYVIAARARGLKGRVVAMGYIVRNSMLPLTSLLGYTISFMVSTAVFVEFVFGYNGVGDLLVDGIINRDYPILEGGLFYVTLLVIVLSLVGDFLLLRLDPRLRR